MFNEWRDNGNKHKKSHGHGHTVFTLVYTNDFKWLFFSFYFSMPYLLCTVVDAEDQQEGGKIEASKQILCQCNI